MRKSLAVGDTVTLHLSFEPNGALTVRAPLLTYTDAISDLPDALDGRDAGTTKPRAVIPRGASMRQPAGYFVPVPAKSENVNLYACAALSYTALNLVG